jgi:hypothetical protein
MARASWRDRQSRYIVKLSRGGGGVRNIASLLFGDDAGELLDLITGEGGITGTDGGDREAADRVLRSGEWCGSTPGRGSGDRAAEWPRGGRRGIVIRNGRI